MHLFFYEMLALKQIMPSLVLSPITQPVTQQLSIFVTVFVVKCGESPDTGSSKNR